MEPTSTCRVEVVTSDGLAVSEVAISMSPNTAWSPEPGGIVGHDHKTTGILLSRLEETQQFVQDNPDQFYTQPLLYFVSTDAERIAIVTDLSCRRRGPGPLSSGRDEYLDHHELTGAIGVGQDLETVRLSRSVFVRISDARRLV